MFAIAAIGAGLPGSNFEIDTPSANLVVNGPAPAIDWASVSETRKNDLPSGSGDDSFGNGTKEDTSVPSVVDGSIPPNKSDLLNFGVYLETNANGRFLNLFWRRVQDPSGTTNMDFELNQSSSLSGNGVTPVRTAGDLLIQYDLANGGTNPELFLSRWVTTGAGSQCQASNAVPCWGTRTNLSAAGDATGSINTSAILQANSDGLGPISARTFGEAQVDFDALAGGPGTCTSFGSAYLKSRSSDSFSAALKDFIAPVPTSISNCAKVIIRKQTDPDENPNTTQFGYTKSINTSSTTANTFSLVDDGNQTYNDVLFGTGYTVEETTVGTGYAFDNVNCSASTGVTPTIAGAKVTFAIDASTDILDCTYTNNKDAKVTIVKDAVPNDAQDFDFTGSFGAFVLDDDGATGSATPSSRTFTVSGSDSAFGSKTVTETGEDGWSLTDITCSEGTDSGSTATLQVDPGDDITCTFTNTKDAKVTIVKDAIPNSDQDFSYTTTGSGPTAWVDGFSLDDGGDATLSNSQTFTFPAAQQGSKTVIEGNQPGWTLTNLTCSEGSTDLALRKATLQLDPGDDITCTFENTKNASITVIKDAVPDDAQQFTYDTTGTGLVSQFSLEDDGVGTGNTTTFNIPGSQLGEKTITERTVGGWTLTDLQCSEGNEDVPNRTATLQVDAGDSITCTFTNTQEASITVVKDAVPNDAANFDYSTTGSGPALWTGGFALDDDSDGTLPNSRTFTFPAAQLGSKTVTEDVPAGWSLTDLVCSEGDEDIPSATATVQLDAGEHITCTFTNTKDATITIVKDAIPDDTQVFGYTTGGLFVSSFDLVDDGNPAAPSNTKEITVSGTNFGQKTVSENEVDGWTLTEIDCSEGGGVVATRTATLQVDPGDDITCTFTNVKDAKVTIIKDAVPDAAQDFDFTTVGAGLSDFSLDDDADADLSNEQEFTIEYPDFGEKTVTEGGVFGWDLTNITCSDERGDDSSGDVETRTATLNVAAGDVIECTFTNTQRNSLIIQKQAKDASTPQTGLEPLGGVTFEITPNPVTGSGSLVVSDMELGEDGDDAFNATRGLICVDNVDPDIASFSIAETDAPAGYKKAATQSSVTSTLGSCAGRTTADEPDAVFENIPLSTIEVLFSSQAEGENGGATVADIDCVDGDGNPISPDAGSQDDEHETYSDLEPNDAGKKYTCTVFVDP